MLSWKELFTHSFFSGMATLCILGGLLGAKNLSSATNTYINNQILMSKLLTALGATLILAGLVMITQRAGLRMSYFVTILLIYLPAFASLAWAIKVYIRGVLTI
jgi:hypothetical protein